MKIDELRSMKRDRKEPLSEQETLELRLDLLNQQEQEKLKSNNELLKTLNALNKNITEANREIQRNAREVRSYPVEAVERVTSRIERCLEKCEVSAQRAQRTYEEATQLVNKFEDFSPTLILTWVIASGVLSSLLTGITIWWGVIKRIN